MATALYHPLPYASFGAPTLRRVTRKGGPTFLTVQNGNPFIKGISWSFHRLEQEQVLQTAHVDR